ncbi:MAG TPA: TIGR00730 family Rossman fold protein [Gemmatimonadaceae bacterium]|nr:TIGR00730 family Rossman fold protein [Gemmatimonadaceae bacterium]
MHSTPFRRVAVFCGSGTGSELRFLAQAHALGRDLAARGIGVVYGGASVGCMGAVADGALSAGGDVIGVITRGLESREIAHRGLGTLEVVETMHERKARMAVLSDAVIALPGGYGTFDELFEALTWSQLQIDRKPIGVLDADGFWQPLLSLLDASVTAGFVRPGNRELITHASELDTLLAAMARSAAAGDAHDDRSAAVHP